jgi:SsrA-binding protein
MALVTNKKVHFDYEILETFEAGISLLGNETKSVRGGQANLAGAHVSMRGNEAFLLQCHIPPYQVKNTPTDYDPDRPRKLLLTEKEIRTISRQLEQRGLTLVPLSFYNKGRHIKCQIAVVRGKKKYDKRESLKKRDVNRELQREFKR